MSNKQLTELIFILDRSGSMHGLEADTIGGFNRVLEENRQMPGQANVTTILFDSRRSCSTTAFPWRRSAP